MAKLFNRGFRIISITISAVAKPILFHDYESLPLLVAQSRPHSGRQNVLARDRLVLATTIPFVLAL